jgi:hypothetical protein
MAHLLALSEPSVYKILRPTEVAPSTMSAVQELGSPELVQICPAERSTQPCSNSKEPDSQRPVGTGYERAIVEKTLSQLPVPDARSRKGDFHIRDRSP